MRASVALITLCLLAINTSILANKTPISNDTTTPNVFWFSSSEYLVDESETNLVVTVDWSCGNRGWSGWVDFFSTPGSATAGEDFTSVSNRLYFSGPGPQSFIVPIHSDPANEGEETIELHLANASAILQTSNAVIRIRDVSPLPKLMISPGGNGNLVLSWPGKTSEFILETASEPNGNWTEVAIAASLSNGSCCVTQSVSGPLGFFRLKKAASQP